MTTPRRGFTPDHRGLAKLLVSAGVRTALKKKADAVLHEAYQNAPVDTGAYRASLHIESDTTDRAVERVVADVDHAAVVEFKTRNLGRAIDAARRG